MAKILPIRTLITFFEDDIREMKTEEDVDRIFTKKVEQALSNFKVDLKKILKEKNAKNNSSQA
jgi:hypothetical protein